MPQYGIIKKLVLSSLHCFKLDKSPLASYTKIVGQIEFASLN